MVIFIGMYEVKANEFCGPLDKLLELIETKKLDITRISLAEVTADFLKYVDELKEKEQSPKGISPRVLADFLVVASQLILIKSKAILPELKLSDDEEESIQELEKRLKIYSEVKPMFAEMKSAWNKNGQSFSREMFSSIQPFFYPANSITQDNLLKSINNILVSLGSLFMEHEKIERQLITLEQKIKDLSQRITEGISKFSQMVYQKPKQEVIVTFLALLHLLRDQLLRVKQAENFDDIEIEKM